MNKNFKIINNQYVIDEENKPINNDWYLRLIPNTPYQVDKHYVSYRDDKKLIATINTKIEGVPVIVVEDEVEKLANKEFHEWRADKIVVPVNHRNPFVLGFIKGYKASEQTHPYSEEDLRKAFQAGVVYGYKPTIPNDNNALCEEDYIQSLKQSKQIESVELEMEDCELTDCKSTCSSRCQFPHIKIHNQSTQEIIPVKVNYK